MLFRLNVVVVSSTRREVEQFDSSIHSLTLWITYRLPQQQQEKLESQYHCRLSEDEFPFVKPPVHLAGSPQSSGTGGTGGAGGSGGTGGLRAVSSFRTKGAAAASTIPSPIKPSKGVTAGALRTDNQRVFIFFVGGFTYSELRLAHHMSETLNKDVFVGGTSLLTPTAFIESLRRLSKKN